MEAEYDLQIIKEMGASGHIISILLQSPSNTTDIFIFFF